MKMKQKLVSFYPIELHRLKARAKYRRISVNVLIREAVNKHLEAKP